jgi:phosphoribosylglycinamide formyltransferase 2
LGVAFRLWPVWGVYIVCEYEKRAVQSKAAVKMILRICVDWFFSYFAKLLRYFVNLKIENSFYMTNIGNPLSLHGKKAVLCGSGELGKEVTIELQRYGVEVVALDRYAGAPAMHVANSFHVLSMLDAEALGSIIEQEKPDMIIPEVEAIATQKLIELEKKGYNVIPTAKATWLTMNREGIRRLAAEELGLPTSRYEFASTEEEFRAAVARIGCPCVVKPVMSSSGHGQSVIRDESGIDAAWKISQEGGRAGSGKVIVEGFVDFDYEITLLTVRHSAGTTFLRPVGHHQVDGDYRESWQPQAMSREAERKAQEIAGKITGALGGYGIFGVELFVKGEDVIFSEVSPRPHDTGMVTMISQDMSEFALHARAVLGLPVPEVRFYGPSASKAIVVEGDTSDYEFCDVDKVLEEPGVQVRFFGKPQISGHRRVGVILATDETVEKALAKAERAYSKLKVKVY